MLLSSLPRYQKGKAVSHLIAYDSQALMLVFMFAFQAQDDSPEDWTSVQNFIGELKSKVKTPEVVSGARGIQVYD